MNEILMFLIFGVFLLFVFTFIKMSKDLIDSE